MPLRVQCYTTFIECIFLYDPSAVFSRLSEMSRKSINRVVDLADFLGGCDFDTIETVHERIIKTRCLKLITTGQTNPVFVFDQLPSGRYKSVKARVNI